MVDFIVDILNAISNGIAQNQVDQLLQTPAAYNAQLYSLSLSVAQTAVKPVASMVLAIVFTLELARVSSKVDGDRELGVKMVATAMIKIMLVFTAAQHSELFLKAIDQLGQGVMDSFVAASPTTGDTSTMGLGDQMRDDIDAAGVLGQLPCIVLLIIPFLVSKAASIVFTVVLLLRFVQIYMMTAFNPLPIAFIACDETRQWGRELLQTVRDARVPMRDPVSRGHHVPRVRRQRHEREQLRKRQQPERLDDRIMLLWGRDWHPGVIGIVASRLVERTGRPVIVVSVDEHGEGKGSGRSVQGFNLHECIASCADILLRFGGHAMAAGLSVREEDLQTLRQRLNDWAARECPVLRTPPLECDLSVHLDRLTVESVRRLDQLAPYGADNPSPVFVLERAVVEGVYAVSEGKHCRLRLRQGSSSIYAVWFGMHPEQVPYSTGDVVDAAISLSVYDSPRGAQLSGRIIELHPAGLGNTAAEQAALVQALRRGTPLTPEQKESIAPERSHIITVYRELQARRWHAEDLQPLFAKLGEENTGRTLVAISALEQVGLITAADRGGAKFWELVPATGKKNLADAPILKCLEER